MRPTWRNSAALSPWVLVALVESAALTPWIVLLFSWRGGMVWSKTVPGLWLSVILFLAGAVWEAGASTGTTTSGMRRLAPAVIGSAIGYAITYAFLPGELTKGIFHANAALIYVPFAAYLVDQGGAQVTAGLSPDQVTPRFTRQFFVNVGGILALTVNGAAAQPSVKTLLYWTVLLLFAAGLSLILLVRDRATKVAQGQSGAPASAVSSAHWRSAVSLGLVAGAVVLSAFLSPERLDGALRWASHAVAAPVQWVIDVFLLILLRWVQMVLVLLQPLLGRAAHRSFPPAVAEDGGVDPLQQMRERMKPGPPLIEQLMPYLTMAVVMGLALLGLFWLYRRRQRGTRPTEIGIEEQRVSLGFWQSLWTDLHHLGKFGSNAGVKSRAEFDLSSLSGDHPRVLYWRLLRWADQRGRRRKTGETPSSYAAVLSERHPDRSDALHTVTAVYNETRYGESLPSAAQLSQAVKAVEDLEQNTSSSTRPLHKKRS